MDVIHVMGSHVNAIIFKLTTHNVGISNTINRRQTKINDDWFVTFQHEDIVPMKIVVPKLWILFVNFLQVLDEL